MNLRMMRPKTPSERTTTRASTDIVNEKTIQFSHPTRTTDGARRDPSQAAAGSSRRVVKR
jgi:hypothetical protein